MYYDKTRKSLLDLWDNVGLLLADNEQEWWRICSEPAVIFEDFSGTRRSIYSVWHLISWNNFFGVNNHFLHEEFTIPLQCVLYCFCVIASIFMYSGGKQIPVGKKIVLCWESFFLT